MKGTKSPQAAMKISSLFGVPDLDVRNFYEKEEELRLEDGTVITKPYREYQCYTSPPPNNGMCSCGARFYVQDERTMEVIASPVGNKPSVLNVHYTRYRCKSCKNKWRPVLDFLWEGKTVKTKRRITNQAAEDIAFSVIKKTYAEVTENYMLTENTIKNVFMEYITDLAQRVRFKTPAFMGIDEIKVKKIGEITVITDLEHKTVYDMIPARNQTSLTQYFSGLPNADKVMWVCSDMYRPFEKSIAQALPNARWTIDHFHVVMKANEALDYVRKKKQEEMTKSERIKSKHGLAYTLKKRLNKMDVADGNAIKALRASPKYAELAVAFDLKEAFFNIYDDNPKSKDNAIKAFEEWEASIPADPIYDKFRELAATVHHFHKQIFACWDCPTQISNAFTECSNRLIRETNIKGRGYSFEVLKARTLYRSVNLRKVDAAGMLEQYGPAVNNDFVLFYTEGDEIDNVAKRTKYEKRQRRALSWDEALDDETLDYFSRHADYDEDDNGTMEVPPDLTVYLDDYEE